MLGIVSFISNILTGGWREYKSGDGIRSFLSTDPGFISGFGILNLCRLYAVSARGLNRMFTILYVTNKGTKVLDIYIGRVWGKYS